MASQRAWDKTAISLGYRDEITMLKDLYEVHQLPVHRVAALFKCSYSTLRYRMKKYGICLRPVDRPQGRIHTLANISDQELFADGSISQLARELEVARSTIYRERYRRRPSTKPKRFSIRDEVARAIGREADDAA